MRNIWILGARPKTLPAAIAPVLVATAYAANDWNPTNALLALLVSLSLQVGVNYANDYSDGIKGVDDSRTGPTRLTASGLAAPMAVKRAALISFAFAAVIGLILAFITTWWLIPIGALAIAAAWYYTGGAKPYGYRGWGDLSVFIFFGVVATTGTYFVQTQTLNFTIFVISVPMGSLSCALLAINNLRDREQDQIASKRTMAVWLGDRGARNLYLGHLVCAHFFALLSLQPYSALTLLALPISFSLARKVKAGHTGSDLIPVLVKTGELQLIFSLLFTLGLVI